MLPHRALMRKPWGDTGCNKTASAGNNDEITRLASRWLEGRFNPFFYIVNVRDTPTCGRSAMLRPL